MNTIKREKSSFAGRIYLLAAASSIIFLLVGVIFIRNAMYISKQETVDFIKTATWQTKFAIYEHINEEFKVLRAAAKPLEEKPVLDDENLLKSLAGALGEVIAYTQIGLIDTEGRAMWLDSDNVVHRKVVKRAFVRKVLAGKAVISKIVHEPDSNMDVNYMGVPLYRYGKVRGILFVAIPESILRNVINNSLYAGQGLAHIIDRSGNFVLRSNSPLRLIHTSNIFDAQSLLSEDIRKKLSGDMAAGKTGYIEQIVHKENRIAAYTPLDVNDWYVFYIVPEDLVSAGIKRVSNGAVGVIAIGVAASIMFIWFIRQINQRNSKKLEQLAFEDQLTGKRNYQKFLMDASYLLDKAGDLRYCLLYSDFKGFRYINDMFGRGVGDQLLKQWADFIEQELGPNEAFARVNADVFVALCVYESKKELRQRFVTALEKLRSFPPVAGSYNIDLYTGVYLVDKIDGHISVEDMLDRAITAQKRIKGSRDGKFIGFYNSEMREQKLKDAEIEAKMEAALLNDEFMVYFQPKIDIKNRNRVMGMEALVRWLPKGQGVIPPSVFIELFEKNGFIVKLDRYVFEKACQFFAANMDEFIYDKIVMSVNVSRLGLLRRDFVETYAGIKDKYKIPAGCIELEFTESLAFDNYQLFSKMVGECRKAGFLCSMDDFGAGHSCLNMLNSLQIDVLKLDRLFFRYEEKDRRGRELVSSIISMARTLGIKTVAEGVDKEYHVEQLREMGCDAIQGYVFAKPMPPVEFKAFFRYWQKL